ncbi:hypothetical protein D9754_12815 [Planomicrobium sp. Y74]|nr:hypothetical protein D9754_12815 [Planomicrobium sp. Y74]
MAFFAIAAKTEATRGTGPRESGHTEKRRHPFSSDRHKTIWRSGVFSAAQPKWLMTRRAGSPESGHRKATAPV